MITAQAIKDYAKLNGMKVHEYYPSSSIEGEQKSDHRYMVGIEMSQYMFYWWDLYVYDVKDLQTELFFSHRYSQKTGGTTKSFSTGFNAEIKIRKLIGEKLAD